MNLGSSTAIEYQHSAFGTWGNFTTSAGRVQFLETKARLGSSGVDKESRLTKLLLPVREILDLKSLDFNQLLQRDLDDHRVAQKLVPYVLRPQATGPAFFPPIVVSLLPFNEKEPKDQFPAKSDLGIVKDHLGFWAGYANGAAFKFQRSVTQEGDDFEIRIGRLSWNPEQAKLVVIDGQHRAMALLAIDRTINHTWPGTGEKYRHFYEPIINEILRDLKKDGKNTDFSNVEFPVNICWFPDLDSSTDNQQKAARKLFVDLNGSAKPPSPSRLMLLSDTELVNIFARRLLSEFRQDEGPVPIYAIEYDSPERDASGPGKWSTMSSLSVIASCIKRSVFGPDKYIANVNTPFGGRESDRDMDTFMRERLEISDFIPEVTEDGERTIKREKVGNKEFPLTKLQALEDRFRDTWGVLIIEMLQSLLPYKAHAEALKEMYNGWATGDSFALLAKDAVFEGVGMYWTLRDSAEAFGLRNDERRLQHLPLLSKTDVVKAWDEIDKKRKEFTVLRAKHYLGKDNKEAVDLSEASFQMFNTHACQLGFVLAIATIVYKSKFSRTELPAIFTAFVSAANAALALGPQAKKFKRRTVLVRTEKPPFNSIQKMDTPLAPYFRYFWLELLATPEAQELYKEHVEPEVIFALRDSARMFYFDYVEAAFYKSAKFDSPGSKDIVLKTRATESASEQMKRALDKWFSIPVKDTVEWLAKRNVEAASGPAVTVTSELGDDVEVTPEAPDDSPQEETADQILDSL